MGLDDLSTSTTLESNKSPGPFHRHHETLLVHALREHCTHWRVALPDLLRGILHRVDLAKRHREPGLWISSPHHTGYTTSLMSLSLLLGADTSTGRRDSGSG
jgi:hypothetical protein